MSEANCFLAAVRRFQSELNAFQDATTDGGPEEWSAASPQDCAAVVAAFRAAIALAQCTIRSDEDRKAVDAILQDMGRRWQA